MLDLCKPVSSGRTRLFTLILAGFVLLGYFVLKEPWIWGVAFAATVIVLFYGFYTQAIKLIRGEMTAYWPTGKAVNLDERQVRNDLIAVDIAWLLNLYIIMGVWGIESEGWLPQGIWPALVLVIGLIIRFTMRWLLDRYA